MVARASLLVHKRTWRRLVAVHAPADDVDAVLCAVDPPIAVRGSDDAFLRNVSPSSLRLGCHRNQFSGISIELNISFAIFSISFDCPSRMSRIFARERLPGM